MRTQVEWGFLCLYFFFKLLRILFYFMLGYLPLHSHPSLTRDCFLPLTCCIGIVLYGIVKLELHGCTFLFPKECTQRHELHLVKAGGWDRAQCCLGEVEP